MSSFRRTILGALAIAAFFVWYAVFASASGELMISFLDVGQGDAIFIETPKGQQILVDGGSGRRVLSELSRVMPALDRSIDLVISTHADLDHLGGLVEVLRRYRVEAALENGLKKETDAYPMWDKEIRLANTPRHIVRAGLRIVLDSGAYIDILGPLEDDDKPNGMMVVARLVYGETEFLLTGDLEREDELRLLASGLDVKSDVLKVAHHGSRFSTTDLFLEKVAPEYAVISVGSQNRYGHPHSETLERLAHTSARILRTDTNGRITLVSDGASIRVE